MNQSLRTEFANALTHGLGIVFSIVALPILLAASVVHADMSIAIANAVYGFGMLMMFSSSTLYHAVQQEDIKKLLRICDHISIFLCIGGTYTAVMVRYLDGFTATWFLSLQWSFIVGGIILKIFFTGRFRLLSSIIYLALGWMAVLVGKTLWAAMPSVVLWWLLIGGICYSVGVIFYQVKKIPYNHAIWHLWVLAAAISHYIGILYSAS